MKFALKLILVFVFTIFSSSAIAQTIHTEPLDAYWKLIEPLKTGDSLSNQDWKTFLDIEANKIYVENQAFSEEYLERFRKTIEFVYMPKYDSLLKARLAVMEVDTFAYWLTYKVYAYKKHEKELKAYQAQILNPSYLDSMYKNTFQWIPKRLQQKDTSVQIYLLGMENDAIAGEGIIILTLWDIYNHDRVKLASLIGHEMHHVLRKGIDFENVSENELGLMYALNSVLNEGSADMIDKPSNLSSSHILPRELYYDELLLYQADSTVAQLDSSILKMVESKGKIYKTEKEVRNLVRWTSGHCPGYYMANIIVRNGFREELIENVQNPFYFIYLYNKAAKKDAKKPHVFTKTSIDYVKSMEKKYWKKK